MWQQYNVFGDFPPHDVTQRLHQIKQEDDISSVYVHSERKITKKKFQSRFSKIYRSNPQNGLLWHEEKKNFMCYCFLGFVIKLFKKDNHEVM